MRTVVKNIGFILTVVALGIFSTACKDGKIDKVKYGNCSDRIRNQNEEDVDCGGVCMPCMSCNDGIKNGTETGIDCGGSCQSCSPGCSVTPGKVDYSVTIPQLSTPVQESESFDNSIFSNGSSELELYFSGGQIITSMTIEFMDKFNPFDFIQIGETMVFTTVDYMSSEINTRAQIKVKYNGNGGPFGLYGSINKDQSFYMTKTPQGSLIIKACSAIGDNGDKFSMNVDADK